MSLLSQRVQECFAYLNTTVPSPCLNEVDYSFICAVLIDYTLDANDMSLLSKRVQECFLFFLAHPIVPFPFLNDVNYFFGVRMIFVF